MNFLTQLCHLENKRIILASQSPRREEMLRAGGLEFEVVPAQTRENPHHFKDEIDYVRQSAHIKASWVWERVQADLLIAADTIVVKDGQIFEKPRDDAEARAVLKTLSGVTHQVITAFCLRSRKQEIIDHEITDVTFYPLTEREIDAYLSTGEPYDKAGGYGIQGWGGIFIEKVQGCYFNVVGFPLGRFYQRLKELNI